LTRKKSEITVQKEEEDKDKTLWKPEAADEGDLDRTKTEWRTIGKKTNRIQFSNYY
jgi:hypothetical protein